MWLGGCSGRRQAGRGASPIQALFRRYSFTATLLGNGRVLVAGGSGSSPSSAELFNPATGTFALTGSMSFDRILHAATLLTSGAVLITGGASSTGVLAAAELYHPSTGLFKQKGSMQSRREGHTSTRMSDCIV